MTQPQGLVMKPEPPQRSGGVGMINDLNLNPLPDPL